MFERLVYVSRAAEGVGPREAYDIIRVSHNRNASAGLTGALLLLDGHFVQVLEGDSHRLRRRYAAILADPRHDHVDLRLAHSAVEPLFPDDWMALRCDADLSAALLADLGYAHGLPVAQWPGERVLGFVQACCNASLATAQGSD